MADPGRSRSTNRAILAAVVVLSLVAGAAAVFGDRSTEPGAVSTTTTTTTPDGSATSMVRPAETSTSWFDHAFGVEQYDFVMDELSCDSVDEIITVDLCGVAATDRGNFMLVGSESYWDPRETDNDGFAYIPFQLSAHVMQDSPRRAVGVLDGYDDKAYTANVARLDLYSARIAGSEMLVLHKHLADDDADAYSFWDSLQILSMSPTGAPQVVATYEGARLKVARDGDAIVLSSLRYKSSASGDTSPWYTNLRLSPSERADGSWDESPASSGREVVDGAGMRLLDSYTFPATRRGTRDEPTDA